MQREEGGFKSKFFGGGGGGKGKAKEVVVVEDEEEERVRVEVVEVLSGGESDVDLEVEGQDEFRGLGQDEGAGAGEGEGEGAAAPPPPLSVMSEEELVLRDHWHEGLLSEDGSPLPPLPPLPLGVELEMEMEVDRAPQVASSCGGISSPGSSPVRSAGAGRRKMRGGAGVGAIREEEEEDEDDDDDEMEVESAVVAVEKVEKVERGFDEGRSEVTSECGLSSPGGGGLEEEEEVEADEGDDDGLSSPSASPTTVKVAVKAEVRVKQEAAVVVKQETGGKKSASAVAYVELSSDPIDLSSDMIIEEQEQGEATPRPLKSKVEPTSSGGSLGGKGGKKSTSSATTKKRPSQVLQDDEEEETEAKEAVVASVAAAWKAKYMMNAGTSKVSRFARLRALTRARADPTRACRAVPQAHPLQYHCPPLSPHSHHLTHQTSSHPPPRHQTSPLLLHLPLNAEHRHFPHPPLAKIDEPTHAVRPRWYLVAPFAQEAEADRPGELWRRRECQRPARDGQQDLVLPRRHYQPQAFGVQVWWCGREQAVDVCVVVRIGRVRCAPLFRLSVSRFACSV